MGAGIEWVPIRSFAPIPKGIDLGLRAEALIYWNKLGLNVPVSFVTPSGATRDAGNISDQRVSRPVFNFAITIGF